MALGKQKTGLGRGFGSLLPTDFDAASLLAEEHERIQKLVIKDLQPNPDQPRQHFDETSLQELAASIKQYGVIQPLVATKSGNGYVIIAGERRWRAAQIAGLKQVPVIVRTVKELEQLEIAIIENVQRVDLSPLEQAVSIERLHQQFNSSYESIASRLGKAHSTVVNIVRLLQLPDEAKEALRERAITEGHARQLLALKNAPEKQTELLALIIKHGWSVRQAERYVTSHKEGVKDSAQTQERVQTETPATEALGQRLGTKVAVKRMAHGGRLEITFRDDDHLQTLLQNLEKQN
jgi:ParB family chromosome partitioning protein